jgi:hypothetical protein
VVDQLLRGFERGYEIIKECEEHVVKGYITVVAGKEGSPEVYDEFMPFKPTNLPENIKVLEFDNVPPPNRSCRLHASPLLSLISPSPN